MVTAIYNEIDGYAARWLRNLVDAGAIAPGAVETRSIRDLRPEDVRDAIQFHAFAGIGGWSYALRLAGWPDDAPVWTGSCPCQPFSAAGKGRGFYDSRHLWPAWFELIRECRPRVVLGEQVASRAGLSWLDVVRADLEREGYAVGAADLAAAGVAAPHIRQRLYIVGLADADRQRQHWIDSLNKPGRAVPETPRSGEPVGVADAARGGRRQRNIPNNPAPERSRSSHDGRMGDADRDGAGRDTGEVPGSQGRRRDQPDADGSRDAGQGLGAWSDAEWIQCRDGRARPAQPGSFPLAYGVPRRVGEGGAVEERARVGELRGYGNAIVPQVAAVWIGAVMEAIGMRPDVGAQALAALGEV